MRRTLLLLILAGCGVARRPADVPPRDAGAPATVPVSRPSSDDGPWAFAWQAGSVAYDVVSEATIEVRDDSMPAEQVRTTTRLSYTVTPAAGASADVQGLVDSVVVEPVGRGGRVTGARQRMLDAPVSFAARLDAERLRVEFPALASVCTSALERTPSGAALVTARDLLLALPANVARGATWRDTVTSTVCRGDLPVTTTAVRSYVVEGRAEWEGAPALRVRRTSELRLGARREGRRPATLDGEGTSLQRFHVDPAGRVLGATAESSLALRLTAGEERGEVRQRARTTIRLVAPRQ